MNIFHIVVSVINIFCGVSAVIGIIYDVESLLTFGIFFGYFANLFTVLVSIFLIILFITRIPTGKAKELLSKSWLGFVNGGFVILVWAIFFIVVN